jgi:hypothetical protein
MKLRTSTLDRITTAYAEAVAAGDFDAAEGWIRTAVFVEGRQQVEPSPAPVTIVGGLGAPAGSARLRGGLLSAFTRR